MLNDPEREHLRKLLDQLTRHSGVTAEQALEGIRRDPDCGVCAEVETWARDRIDERATNHPAHP